MNRSREQNEALARVYANQALQFVHEARELESHLGKESLEKLVYALTHLDRTLLWELYALFRSRRSRALEPSFDDLAAFQAKYGRLPTVDDAPLESQKRFHAFAFAARAALVTSSALKGRARFFLDTYATEMADHAGHLIPKDAS